MSVYIAAILAWQTLNSHAFCSYASFILQEKVVAWNGIRLKQKILTWKPVLWHRLFFLLPNTDGTRLCHCSVHRTSWCAETDEVPYTFFVKVSSVRSLLDKNNTFVNSKISPSNFGKTITMRRSLNDARNVSSTNLTLLIGPATPTQTFHGVHGKNGVTSVRTRSNTILTTGRDGYWRTFLLANASLEMLSKRRAAQVGASG